MNSLFLTVRALSVEFARRLYFPVFIVGAVILGLTIILSIWLTTMSAWWWILFTLAVIASVVFVIISLITRVIINVVRPAQTVSQKKSVKEFVDKLQEVADTVQTPKVFLLIRLVMDTVRPTERGLVQTMSSHVGTTKKDFEAIRKSFET